MRNIREGKLMYKGPTVFWTAVGSLHNFTAVDSVKAGNTLLKIGTLPRTTYLW
jgi:hypothetical protein